MEPFHAIRSSKDNSRDGLGNDSASLPELAALSTETVCDLRSSTQPHSFLGPQLLRFDRPGAVRAAEFSRSVASD